MSVELLEKITKETIKLDLEEKKTLANQLLAQINQEQEQEQRQRQRIKNQAALEFHRRLLADNSGYEEENAELIDEAIAATIRK